MPRHNPRQHSLCVSHQNGTTGFGFLENVTPEPTTQGLSVPRSTSGPDFTHFDLLSLLHEILYTLHGLGVLNLVFESRARFKFYRKGRLERLKMNVMALTEVGKWVDTGEGPLPLFPEFDDLSDLEENFKELDIPWPNNPEEHMKRSLSAKWSLAMFDRLVAELLNHHVRHCNDWLCVAFRWGSLNMYGLEAVIFRSARHPGLPGWSETIPWKGAPWKEHTLRTMQMLSDKFGPQPWWEHLENSPV